jgi:F-type H+-transporting ATPase subunit delta
VASKLGNQDVARRYATALFELAKEQNEIDRIAADLRSLSDVIAASADFGVLMSNVTLKRGDQEKAVLAIADALKFSALGKNFLGVLAVKRRLADLPAIIDAVQAAIAHHKGETTAEVTAAYALDEAQVDGIAAALKKALGLNIKIKLTTDAAIMGGLVIRVGSQLIDSSVRTKLARLTRALKSQDQSSDENKMKEVA